MRISGLYKRLDREATAVAAEDLLLDYHHRWARHRGWELAGIQSPSITDMPGSDSVNNHQEDNMIAALADAEYLKRCQDTVKQMSDPTEAAIIKYTYLQTMPSVESIAERIGMSRGGYYKAKTKALLAFAEFWPELLVYTYNSPKKVDT